MDALIFFSAADREQFPSMAGADSTCAKRNGGLRDWV
jgi:hypothetical protein